MQISTRKKIEKGLLWLIILMLLFFGFQIIFNYDFFGTQNENKKQAKLLLKVDEVEEAYFGISPFWLRRYNITLTDKKDIFADADNDGLDLKQEYVYLTDPFDADTDKDGYPDGEEIQNDYNPLGGGRLDRNKNGLPDSWEIKFNLPVDRDASKEDLDGDELTNEQEYAHDTDPNKADSDGDGFEDFHEIVNGYDPTVPGDTRLKYEVAIKKIGVAAPIVISKNPEENALQEDLKSGVILYPQSGIPGQIGNPIITGHSSNYAWAKGQYNYIFKNLNTLEPGDEFVIKMSQQNGKSLSYTYKVVSKEVVSPDDQRIFEKSDMKMATLITCWPLNTNLRRLVVRGEIIDK